MYFDLLLVFLLLCNWTKVYHRYYRQTEKDMKWQATNFVSWNGILRLLCKIKLYFGIKFYFVAYWIHLPLHLFHVSAQGTLASPRTKTIAKFVEKGNLTTIWQQFIWNGKKMKTQMKYQIFFFNVGWCSCFWRDIYNCYLYWRNFCDQKLFKGNLVNFLSKKLQCETLCN